MKKVNLLLLGLFFTLIVNGQAKKISIGITGSPDFYNYDFKDKADEHIIYKTKTNYSAGLRLQYCFTDRFSIKTGLLFSTKGYKVDLHSTWIDPKANSIFSESNLKVSYFDFPIMLSYNFINQNKFSCFTSIGLISSYLTSDKEITHYYWSDSEEETNMYNQYINNRLLATALDFGIKYNFTKKLFVTFEPYFRYEFFQKNAYEFKSNPISYGAFLGLNYNIN